jgi:hypothetical protein
MGDQGNPVPHRPVLLVRRDDSGWLIEASHNTNIVAELVGPERRKPTP